MRAFQKVKEAITPPILLLIQYLPDVCVVSQLCNMVVYSTRFFLIKVFFLHPALAAA